MTLPQIEREAGKVKLNRKKIATNSWFDRFTDILFLGLFIVTAIVLTKNLNRIDENIKIIAERSSINHTTETTTLFGHQILKSTTITK